MAKSQARVDTILLRYHTPLVALKKVLSASAIDHGISIS